MGKCILAGHPPAGNKIAFGTFDAEYGSGTIDISNYGFTNKPIVSLTLENKYSEGYATLRNVSCTQFDFRAPSCGILHWIAIGT